MEVPISVQPVSWRRVLSSAADGRGLDKRIRSNCIRRDESDLRYDFYSREGKSLQVADFEVVFLDGNASQEGVDEDAHQWGYARYYPPFEDAETCTGSDGGISFYIWPSEDIFSNLLETMMLRSSMPTEIHMNILGFEFGTLPCDLLIPSEPKDRCPITGFDLYFETEDRDQIKQTPEKQPFASWLKRD